MKRYLIGAMALLAATSGAAWARGSHPVHGYTTKNGVVVVAHRATNPDASRANNWSSKPNVNPYTGRAGTVDPTSPRRR